MLIELIRVIEFIVTCLIVLGTILLIRKWWINYQLSETKKREKLKKERYRQSYGPHGSSATMKTPKQRQDEEWKV